MLVVLKWSHFIILLLIGGLMGRIVSVWHLSHPYTSLSPSESTNSSTSSYSISSWLPTSHQWTAQHSTTALTTSEQPTSAEMTDYGSESCSRVVWSSGARVRNADRGGRVATHLICELCCSCPPSSTVTNSLSWVNIAVRSYCLRHSCFSSWYGRSHDSRSMKLWRIGCSLIELGTPMHVPFSRSYHRCWNQRIH